MGNLCGSKYFLLNNNECSLCQEPIGSKHYWNCKCKQKYHVDCMVPYTCCFCDYTNKYNSRSLISIK